MNILGFDYPDGCLFDLEQDMWCRTLADGSLRVGITAFGVHLSGDFHMCRPKPAGSRVARGGKLGVAELSKTVIALKSPVAGTIVEVNALLEDRPQLIHQDPHGRGWIVRIQPDCLDDASASLCHGAALPPAAQARMRLENIAFPGVAGEFEAGRNA